MSVQAARSLYICRWTRRSAQAIGPLSSAWHDSVVIANYGFTFWIRRTSPWTRIRMRQSEGQLDPSGERSIRSVWAIKLEVGSLYASDAGDERGLVQAKRRFRRPCRFEFNNELVCAPGITCAARKLTGHTHQERAMKSGRGQLQSPSEPARYFDI